MDDLARAVAFEETLRRHCVDRVGPLPYGHVVYTPSLPKVWDLNNVRVERADGMSARDLAVEAERLLGGAGLAHRRVAVLDGPAGEGLAPEFRSLGWRAERYVYMVRRRAPEREAALARVHEVEWARLAPIREAITRTEPWGDDDETVAQLREATQRLLAAARARHFAVLDANEVVAAADLYSDGRTAQVEDVATLPEHRGRGHATAVVLRAVAEADRGGHDFVFLIADDDDWPKHLYRRLGFDEVGHKWSFLKPPPPSATSA